MTQIIKVASQNQQEVTNDSERVDLPGRVPERHQVQSYKVEGGNEKKAQYKM